MISYLRCDKDGVPLTVQKIKYVYSLALFEITFFNGKTKDFTADMVCSNYSISQHEVTKYQYYEAELRVTKLADRFWSVWFPDE